MIPSVIVGETVKFPSQHHYKEVSFVQYVFVNRTSMEMI
jgi:hypothetical protein